MYSANQERVLSARLSAVSQTGMQNSQKAEAVFHEVLNCFLRSTYISLSRAKIVDGRFNTNNQDWFPALTANKYFYVVLQHIMEESLKWLAFGLHGWKHHRLPNQHVRDSQIFLCEELDWVTKSRLLMQLMQMKFAMAVNEQNLQFKIMLAKCCNA